MCNHSDQGDWYRQRSQGIASPWRIHPHHSTCAHLQHNHEGSYRSIRGPEILLKCFGWCFKDKRPTQNFTIHLKLSNLLSRPSMSWYSHTCHILLLQNLLTFFRFSSNSAAAGIQSSQKKVLSRFEIVQCKKTLTLSVHTAIAWHGRCSSSSHSFTFWHLL